MIAPLLRAAASAAAARSLRVAAHGVLAHTMMTIGAAAAIAVAAVCLTCSAYIVLARSLDPAGAWAILGGFWGSVGFAYFIVASRRGG